MDAGEHFEAVKGPAFMGCAFERAGKLYACGRWEPVLSFGGIGISTNAGDRFEPLMQFEEVCAPVACDARSPTVAACDDLWRDWQYEIHGCTGVYGDLGPPSSVTAPATRARAPLPVCESHDRW